MKLAYIEMPLSVFVSLYPRLKSFIPADVDLSDEDYIVRLDPSSGFFEIGYPDDDWMLRR